MAAAFCSRARERLPSMQLATGDSVTRTPLVCATRVAVLNVSIVRLRGPRGGMSNNLILATRTRRSSSGSQRSRGTSNDMDVSCDIERHSVMIHFASMAVSFCLLGNNESFSAFLTFRGHRCLGVGAVDGSMSMLTLLNLLETCYRSIPTLVHAWLDVRLTLVVTRK